MGADSVSALPIFLDTALKGALLVALGGLAALLLRHRSAAARHAAWTAAVVAHLALPVLTITVPAIRLPLLMPPPWFGASAGAGGVGPASGALWLATLVWLAGALVVLTRLALGTRRVARLARHSARLDDGAWLALAQRVAMRLGVARPLMVFQGDGPAVPLTWGVVYPAVFLPPGAERWSETRRRLVLVHEMAHIKRLDALTQCLAQVAVALFWFDPLLWLAAHRMRVEREHACDDQVLHDGTTPSVYAGELLDLACALGDAAPRAFAALAMARDAESAEFEGRMCAILASGRDRRGLTGRAALTAALAVTLIAVPLAALRPFREPPAQDGAPHLRPSLPRLS